MRLSVGNNLLAVAFNGDATRLATQHGTGTVQIHNLVPAVEFLAMVNEPVLDNGASGLAYSPDGARVVVASVSAEPTVWDALTGKRVFTLTGHASRVLGVAWSADGATIASAGEDTDVILWDAVTGEPKRTLSGHSGSIYALAFSPDNKRVASSGFDKTVRIWDVATGELLLTLEQPAESKGVAWSPDGKRIAAGTDQAGTKGYVRVWDSVTGDVQLDVFVGNTRTGNIAFNPAGSRILVGLQEEGEALVIDGQTGETMLTLAWHGSNVPGVAYSPDGALIATSSLNDGATIRLWDAETGEERLVLYSSSGVGRIAFSPDGKYLAAHTQDGTTRIYVLAIPEIIALAEARLTRSWTDTECRRYLHMPDCPERYPLRVMRSVFRGRRPVSSPSLRRCSSR
jgi:WD40 repeat protein